MLSPCAVPLDEKTNFLRLWGQLWGVSSELGNQVRFLKNGSPPSPTASASKVETVGQQASVFLLENHMHRPSPPSTHHKGPEP